LSGESIEKIGSSHVQFDESKGCMPVAENREAYEKAYERYQQYVGAMTPLFK